MPTPETLHRLVGIKPGQLRCPRCGEPATVGTGGHRVNVTGYHIGPRLMACEECLQYWATSHRCQTAA